MTAQFGERLINEGEETSMAYCPPLPKGHPRIIRVEDQHIRVEDRQFFSTACWRRYQGTWEIREGRFYLTGLRGRLRLLGDEALPADWFTGMLRIPRGKMLQYVHMGFESIYEEEVHVQIENGRVMTSRVVSNRGKEDAQWLPVRRGGGKGGKARTSRVFSNRGKEYAQWLPVRRGGGKARPGPTRFLFLLLTVVLAGAVVLWWHSSLARTTA
jgi:hypothetical protein